MRTGQATNWVLARRAVARLIVASAIIGAAAAPAAAETHRVRIFGKFEATELKRVPEAERREGMGVVSELSGPVSLSLSGLDAPLTGQLSGVAMHYVKLRSIGGRVFLALDLSESFDAEPEAEMLYIYMEPRAFGPGPVVRDFQGRAQLTGGEGRFRDAAGEISLIFNSQNNGWGNDGDAIELPNWRPKDSGSAESE